MEIDKDKTPALYQLLVVENDCPPSGCSECPFAKASERGPWEDYPAGTDVNPADPDEGHYDCSLLKKEEIWGEDPQCETTDWQRKALEELENKD